MLRYLSDSDCPPTNHSSIPILIGDPDTNRDSDAPRVITPGGKLSVPTCHPTMLDHPPTRPDPEWTGCCSLFLFNTISSQILYTKSLSLRRFSSGHRLNPLPYQPVIIAPCSTDIANLTARLRKAPISQLPLTIRGCPMPAWSKIPRFCFDTPTTFF